jgi:hypothetical protein
MINLRTLVKLAAPILVISTASCADAPTQPAAPPPNASLVDGLVGTLGGTLGGVVGGVLPELLACPTSTSYSSTTVVGRYGGVVRVGPHSLVIPPGALGSNVTISATAPAGKYVEVQFEPHGLRFERPAALNLSYNRCGLVQGLLMSVVYIDDDRKILEVLSSSNNIFARTVTGKLDHFSGYAVATRSSTRY